MLLCLSTKGIYKVRYRKGMTARGCVYINHAINMINNNYVIQNAHHNK